MPSSAPPFADLISSCTQSAVHLEMRDVYSVENERTRFDEWRSGVRLDPDDEATWWRPWVDLIRKSVARGIVVRRARIISEPVTEYIRFEHSGTFTNVAAGESVRWLPRRRASDIALPGNDFWLFDGRLIRWNHFTGDGASAGQELSDNPTAAALCESAFEAVWERATPHDQYEIH
ncbi:DUF6879 family protein [Streptomyces sp. NPDC048584]|uniref:DUF6879 family protein n=1 Tax=Streptomyces sp. NPDC048584 TaxID=3365573 RepID=UPI00371973DD